MISKARIKDIAKYQQKKYRDSDNVFIAEGNKLVSELLNCFKCKTLLTTEEWKKHFNQDIQEAYTISNEDIKRVSTLKNPQGVYAIFEKPNYIPNTTNLPNQLSLALDDIQDPGNLGTIIRIADWYGIENIFCSKNSVDVFNPKVIQATMGAICRVKIFYVDLEGFLTEQSKHLPIYGTFLDGEDMYQKQLSRNGIIVMGNEGNGISKEIENTINEKLYIPNYPNERETSESLNVAIATAIICAEFRRGL